MSALRFFPENRTRVAILRPDYLPARMVNEFRLLSTPVLLRVGRRRVSGKRGYAGGVEST